MDILKQIKEIIKISGSQIDEGLYYTDLDDYNSKYDIFWILNACEMNENLWTPLIKPSQYQTALKEFTKTGKLLKFPVKYIEEWVHIIMKNATIFENCRMLWGEDVDGYIPIEEVYDYYYGEDSDYETFADELYNKKLIDYKGDYDVMQYILQSHNVYDKIKLPDGSVSYSDQQGYSALLDELDDCNTPEEYLVKINEILDVFHQRGDLSSMFVEGGRNALNQISWDMGGN